jgi:rubrerythrin
MATSLDYSNPVHILQMARENEVQTLEFYLRVQERTHSQSARQMYSSLAREEAAHVRLIERQMVALQESGVWADWQLESQAAITPRIDPAELPAKVQEVEASAQPGDSELEALGQGLRLEMNSYTFYADAANKCTAPEACAMFNMLAQMERSHFELLYLEYENLARHGPSGTT